MIYLKQRVDTGYFSCDRISSIEKEFQATIIGSRLMIGRRWDSHKDTGNWLRANFHRMAHPPEDSALGWANQLCASCCVSFKPRCTESNWVGSCPMRASHRWCSKTAHNPFMWQEVMDSQIGHYYFTGSHTARVERRRGAKRSSPCSDERGMRSACVPWLAPPVPDYIRLAPLMIGCLVDPSGP